MGNLAKFTQNEQMRDKLISTVTKTLVESSSIDLTGQNKMGKVLCKVRSDIIQGLGK